MNFIVTVKENGYDGGREGGCKKANLPINDCINGKLLLLQYVICHIVYSSNEDCSFLTSQKALFVTVNRKPNTKTAEFDSETFPDNSFSSDS